LKVVASAALVGNTADITRAHLAIVEDASRRNASPDVIAEPQSIRRIDELYARLALSQESRPPASRLRCINPRCIRQPELFVFALKASRDRDRGLDRRGRFRR
jgi:hypothetical protein